MAKEIRILPETKVGEGFIPPQYLGPDETEYRIRDEQLRLLGKDPSDYRSLTTHELEILVRNNNTCNDWSHFLVKDPFCPELVRNNLFSGLIRISKLEHVSLEHHDIAMAAGIFNSQIIACDIGDNCIISNCAYLSHYIIDDHCILINNAEIQVSNHAKFGNGIVMESENESVRITLDVMNENGGRWIYPFNGMLSGDAWLWAKFRDRTRLQERFRQMTDARFDKRLGRYGIIGRNSVLKHNRIIKDTYIGESAYIKGSNKLKNLTINSSEDAPTQIGEGVEMVNGILGFGCRVFYGCKAVRFVMCDSSALKYGARTEKPATDINAAIRNIVQLVGYSFREESSIVIEPHLGENLPPAAIGEDECKQIILNLIKNALEAIGTSGRIRIETAFLPSESMVQCVVSDTGKGIPNALLPRIFDPFFSTKAESGNSGLGLSVVYGLVSKFEGLIDVESEVGKGTTVRIKLPAAPSGLRQ
jgi:NDP-sugar pyrophosphorylase family protein